MYLLGGYVGKYEPLKTIGKAKSFAGYVCCSLLTWLAVPLIAFTTKIIFGSSTRINLLFAYNSLVVVCASVFLFNLFKQLKIGENIAKIISVLSKASFGVYLIHENIIISNYFIKGKFVHILDQPMLIIVWVVVAALLIYSICSAIDLLRLGLFKMIKIDKFSSFLEKSIKNVFSFVFKILRLSFDEESEDKTT